MNREAGDVGVHIRRVWQMLSVMGLMLALIAPVQATRTMTSILTNAQGTVVAKMDAAGNVTYTAAYRPYGKQQTGTPQAGPGYTGHVNDPDTRLVYMQARYYDPAVGRFLSVDPDQLSAGGIFNFNDFAYANNSPIINFDPTGRYTCGSKEVDGFCDKIDNYVKLLKKAKSYYQSRSRVKYLILSKVLKNIGENGSGGPNFVAAVLHGKTVALSNQQGTIRVDLSPKKVSEGFYGAGAIAHEVQHDLDAEKWGIAGATNDEATAHAQYLRTEKNAYHTQGVVWGAFGKFMNANETEIGVQGSVSGDMNRWLQSHKQVRPNEPTKR